MKTIWPVLRAILPPLLVGIVVGIVLQLCEISGVRFERLEFLLNAVITCSATFSGFILTSISILIGASTSSIMKKIGKGAALLELQCCYTFALLLGVVTIFYFSYLGAVVDCSNLLTKPQMMFSAGILGAYIVSVLSTSYYLLAIVGHIPKKDDLIQGGSSAPDGEYRVNQPSCDQD